MLSKVAHWDSRPLKDKRCLLPYTITWQWTILSSNILDGELAAPTVHPPQDPPTLVPKWSLMSPASISKMFPSISWDELPHLHKNKMAVSTFSRIIRNTIYVISLLLFNIFKTFKRLNLHFKYRGIQKSERNHGLVNFW